MKTIILVDDNADTLTNIKKYLDGTKKYLVHPFTNPKSAFSELPKIKQPSLLLSDQLIPGYMNGIEFITMVIQTYKLECKDTAFMIMSAFTGENDAVIQKAVETGIIDGFIGKPFKLKYLESRIEDALQKREIAIKIEALEKDKKRLIEENLELKSKVSSLFPDEDTGTTETALPKKDKKAA